jgi:hypothetical protein
LEIPILTDEDRSVLEKKISSSGLSLDVRVLSWARLKAWGNGGEFAVCKRGELRAPRASAIVLPLFFPEQIPTAKNELIAASLAQCAMELDVPVARVRAAAVRLERLGLLKTRYVESEQLVTKHNLGKGFRAFFARLRVRASYPLQTSE